MLRTIESIKNIYPNAIFTKSEALSFAMKIITMEIRNADEDGEYDKVRVLEAALDNITIECFDADNMDGLGDLDIDFDVLHCIDLTCIDATIDSLLCKYEAKLLDL